MDEYNNEEFYEDIYDFVPDEETPVEETPVEEIPVEETPVQNQDEKKEDDQKITIEDIKDILKVVTNNEENKDETPVEETPVEENPVEETPVVEDKEVKEIETHDYSQILNDIQREVSSGNADNQDAQQYIIDYIDNHSVYTPIDSISIDTLLLVLIFTALLTNILVNLIRRLF